MEKIKLLIVEDVHDDAELTVLELSSQGFELEWQRVESSDSMIALLQDQKWDAIISDFMMNGFTAFEALEIAKKYAADLPFIIISGTVGEHVAVEAMRKGAHDYIMKDNLVRLGEALKRELRDAETRRQHHITKINLQDRENQIESILAASPLGIGSLIDRKFTFINDKVCEMLGYSCDELIGQDTRFLYESEEEYTRIGNYIYTSGNASNGNVTSRFLTKSGTSLHISLNYAFIDPSKPTAITFTLEDITEKNMAEIALEESRRKYKYMYTLLRSIGDNMPDMIWAKNTKKEFLFANQALCNHLLNAEDTDEPLGKTDTFFALRERNSHPDDPDWHTFGEICMDSDEIVMKSQKAQRFDEYGNVQGKFLFLDVHKAPLYDDGGRFIGTVGSARDVTKEKEIQARLVDSEKKYRNLIENQGEGVCIVDENENIKFANPAAFQIFAVSEEQLIGKNLSEFVDAETFAKFRQGTEDRRQGKDSSYEVEIILKDGAKKNILVTATPYFDENRVFAGIFGIFRDITERTKLVEDLREAKEKAEQTDRLKSAFLANMSHEIRTPMNSIIGFSDLLMEGDITPDIASSYLDVISKNGEHLLQLIDDIIDIAKIESNQLNIIQRQFNLHALLKETEINFLKHTTVLQKGIILGLDNHDSNPRLISSDEFRIKQLLYNLIQNAIKFSDGGSVRFGYLDPGGDELIFYVKDTGIGIEPEFQKTIFNRFEQGSQEASLKYGGTGLGLSICKGIVELLGGKMWLKSEFGKGSVFYFSIPLTVSENLDKSQAMINREEVARFDFSNLTIIVAEDKEMNMLLFEQILKSKGITVLHANNGQAAIELLKEHPETDMVIMDIKMPVMDGLKATKIIKSEHTDLPILAVTAFAMSEDKEKALQAGCDDYLPKPVTKYSLLEKINKLTRGLK